MAFNRENVALREGFNFDFDPVPPPSLSLSPSLSLPLTVGAGGYHEKESKVGEGDATPVSLSLSPYFTLEMGFLALISVTRGFVPLQLKDFGSSLPQVPSIQGAKPNSWVRPFVSPSLALAPCLRTPPASSWFQDHPVFLPARRRPHHLPRLPAFGARRPQPRPWPTTPTRVQLMRLRAVVSLNPLDSEATGLGSRSTNSLGRVAIGPDLRTRPLLPSASAPDASVLGLLPAASIIIPARRRCPRLSFLHESMSTATSSASVPTPSLSAADANSEGDS